MKYSIENKKGFTLSELLIAIAIISLLASVILTSIKMTRIRARDTKRVADLNQIKIALEMYYDYKGYYPGTYEVIAGGCPNGRELSPPCWDSAARSLSNNSTWQQMEAALSEYISKLPVDPINTPSCSNIGPTCYIYVYARVGRFGINPNNGTSTTKDVYDLAAYLEDPNNPNGCKFSSCKTSTGAFSSPRFWLDGRIYDPSPN